VLKDLFDKEILKYTFLPLLLSLGFWGIMFFIFGGNILNFFAYLSTYLPKGDEISNFIKEYGWSVLIFLWYLGVISTIGLFSSFFIDKIVLRINRHYNCPVKKVNFKDTLKGVFISLKAFFIYLIIFMFTFWMLFIPVVNVVYQLFMWSVLNKAPLEFDSTYLFKIKPNKNFFLVFITSLIYFVPFLSLFGYTFQLIFMTHYNLKKGCK
jgi:hypothetical protein